MKWGPWRICQLARKDGFEPPGAFLGMLLKTQEESSPVKTQLCRCRKHSFPTQVGVDKISKAMRGQVFEEGPGLRERPNPNPVEGQLWQEPDRLFDSLGPRPAKVAPSREMAFVLGWCLWPCPPPVPSSPSFYPSATLVLGVLGVYACTNACRLPLNILSVLLHFATLKITHRSIWLYIFSCMRTHIYT